MRLSLVLHREPCHRDDQGKRGHLPMGLADVQRDQSVAAAETVALVLDEDSPLPESAGDVEELARRLRGNVGQLGFVVPPGASALRGAQQFASAGVPDGYVPSRVHLVKLAKATQALVAAVQAHGVVPCEAHAETALVEAAAQCAARLGLRCRLRPLGSGRVGAPGMTATGAILIAVVLGPMAWLIFRGGRGPGRTVPQDEDSAQGQNGPSPHK